MTPIAITIGYRSIHMICTSPITIAKQPDKKFRCRKCLSCQITKRQEWAMRCVFEAREHKENSFLTLTFSPENLPIHGVETRDLQLFMKRLRKEIYPIKVKYVACGEYGEKLSRPHYHLLLFGYGFPDKKFFKRTRKGELIYRSEMLEKLWPFGHSSIGELNHKTASYVAGYVHKKFNAKFEDEIQHYANDTGTIQNKEFIVCSKGIGLGYFEKYQKQLYNHDYIIYEGRKFPLFEYYNRKFDNSKEFDYNLLQVSRRAFVKSPDKKECKAIDHILKQKFSKKRSLE